MAPRVVFFLAWACFLVLRAVGVELLPSALVATAVGSLAGPISWLGRSWRQSERDEEASELLRAIEQDGACPNFSLYLRSFIVTGKMPTLYQEHGSTWYHDDQSDLETLLAEAVEPIAPLVALGKPGEHFGAGRIQTTDADWRRLVELLASKSRWVFLIPSATEGVLWEVNWLRAHKLLPKTIFLVGDVKKATASASASLLDWATVRKEFAAKGMELPGFFTLRKDGTRVELADLRGVPGAFLFALREDGTTRYKGGTKAKSPSDLREAVLACMRDARTPPTDKDAKAPQAALGKGALSLNPAPSLHEHAEPQNAGNMRRGEVTAPLKTGVHSVGSAVGHCPKCKSTIWMPLTMPGSRATAARQCVQCGTRYTFTPPSRATVIVELVVAAIACLSMSAIFYAIWHAPRPVQQPVDGFDLFGTFGLFCMFGLTGLLLAAKACTVVRAAMRDAASRTRRNEGDRAPEAGP